MSAKVRCPSTDCGAVFEIPEERIGRNVYCLACGERMTAKSLDVAAHLKQRQHDCRGSDGGAIQRLPLTALLDNVRSLWNVGSMFRTADACGVMRLFLGGITGTPPRQEISKTALGAEEVVPWSYCADSIEALETLQAKGHTPVALESSRRAVPLEQMDWHAPVCLVVGNEVAGVSPSLLEACPQHVYIPMGGVKESFNVAVAFGIAAHAAAMALARSSPEVEFS